LKTDSKRIRVTHFVESLETGGMENGIVNLANRFDHSLFDFKICCFGSEGRLAGRIANGGSSVIAFNYGSGLRLQSFLPIAGYLRREKTDIMHTHGWGSRSLIGLLAAKYARTPVCVNGEHGQVFAEGKGQFYAQKVTLPLYDDILSVSEGLKNKVRATFGLPGLHVTVIPNGVDANRFHGRYETGELRAELGLNESAFIIAVVASLKWQKNQHIVLRALHLLNSRNSAVQVIFVGDGPDREELKRLAQELAVQKDAFFLGIRDDIPEILSLADLMVLPSTLDSEGLSNVMLEAMASGVPVVATKSVGSQEIITENENGFFFDPGDAEKLATYMRELAINKDMRKRVAENARALILREYSLDVMVERYQEYYRTLFEKSKTGGRK